MNNQIVKDCIVKALTELMNEKSFEDISITEICNRAGVSRMSYYRNYYSKQDILYVYLEDISKNFADETHALTSINEYTNKNVIKYLFNYFNRYEFFVKILIKANLTSMLLEALNKYLEKEIGKKDLPGNEVYHMYSYAGALYNVYIKWIENGMKESVEEIAEYFCAANNYIWRD